MRLIWNRECVEKETAALRAYADEGIPGRSHTLASEIDTMNIAVTTTE